jgi:general secretion pathway protein B
MSFILDALKKSESDRQRQSGPSLFEVKVTPPRRTLPVWAVAIAVLLGINIIVVSWMLLRHPAAQQPAPAGNPPAAATPPAAVSGGAAESGVRAVPLGAPAGQAVSGGRADSGGERPDSMSGPGTAPPGMASGTAAMSAGMVQAAAPAASAAAPRQASRQPVSAAASNPPPSSADQGSDQGAAPPGGGSASDYAPAVQPAAGSGGSGDNLPLYQQIASSAGIPELHLDLHVFADRPQDRFVMINMHRLGEGDSLPSGVQVAAIRPDGVVLTYHGTRFLLPRN